MQIDNFYVFLNGRFFVSDTGASSNHTKEDFAEALVIRDGIISFVGSATSDSVQQAMEAGAEVCDIGGRSVLPGYLDGHTHLLLLGQSLSQVPLQDCQNLEDIRAAIKEYAAVNPDVPRIFCRGWHRPMTPDGATADMIDDLDLRPIFITSKDLHSTWMNHTALAELKLDNEPNPPGGTIERDPKTGKPSGVISEAANMKYMRPFMQSISTMQSRLAYLRTAIKQYNEAGYTGSIDMTMEEDAWETILELRKQEQAAGRTLTMRIAAHWLIMPRNNHAEHLAQVERAAELSRKYSLQNSPDCCIVGIKLVCDGIIDACTASLGEPYSHNGENSEPVWPQKYLEPVVAAAAKHNLQVAAHAIGDHTVTIAIDAIEKYGGGPERRHRIEHLELTRPEDAQRLGALGITASVQPVHSDPAILRAWPKLIGEERCGRIFAYREFADGGALVAIGTDSPTAPNDLMHNVYVATTRRSARAPELDTVVNPQFALPLCYAVASATLGVAKSYFAESHIGSLEVGKRADFVIMDMEWEKEKLLQSKVTETWFDGRQVYSVYSK
jgi:predicted amidohydrolase YtcJ